MKMEIRSLQTNDQVCVLKIMEEHSFQFPPFIRALYPARWKSFLEEEDQNRSGFYVMGDSEGVIGHAGYVFQEDTNRYEIIGVATKMSRLREGVGNMLIAAICKKIRLLGHKTVILYTLEHERNQAAVAFYERLGFIKLNLEMDYYSTGYHRLTMMRPLNWETPKLVIRSIQQDEIGIVSSILEEAALWLKRTGREMWTKEQYSVEGLLSSYRTTNMYLAFIGDQAVATMILLEEDNSLWPNGEPALYLHKLAVNRQYAGAGLAEAMIGWAKKQACLRGKRYLRLDCAAERPRLCAFYEGQGFIKAREALVLNKYPTAFYEILLR